jgi:hypothetical protein
LVAVVALAYTDIHDICLIILLLPIIEPAIEVQGATYSRGCLVRSSVLLLSLGSGTNAIVGIPVLRIESCVRGPFVVFRCQDSAKHSIRGRSSGQAHELCRPPGFPVVDGLRDIG